VRERAALLCLAVRTPETSAAALELTASADIDAAIDELMKFALAHTTALATMEHLEAAGLDLAHTTVSRTVWESSKTCTSIRPRLTDVSPGRVALADLREAHEQHRRRQTEVLALLGAELPTDCIVLYGQGLAIAHPTYRYRFSHDIDLYATSVAAGRRAVTLLVDQLRYQITVERTGTLNNTEVLDWKLDRDEPDGNRFHVDISAGALANADSWMPPFAVDGLVERARTVRAPWGSAQVPSDTDQILLLAEKSLRNCSFSRREVNDTLVLSHGSIDWDAALSVATRYGLTASLDWMLTAAAATGALDDQPLPNPEPPAWERAAIRMLARDARVPGWAQRSVRAAHQVAWRRRLG